jgi:hypothetical protein
MDDRRRSKPRLVADRSQDDPKPAAASLRPDAMPLTSRSAVTNGSKLLAGVDGRSAGARRFRDLIRAIEAEAAAPIREAKRGLIRQAAALTLRTEQLQAAIVRGENVDGDHLIRIAGTVRRLMVAIQKTNDADLDEILRGIGAA